MAAREPTEITFVARRLTVAVPSVREFQDTLEAAVPDQPLEQVTALVRGNAPWSKMVALLDAAAPYGFFVYSRSDPHSVMRAAGDHADCLVYQIGNHVVAERMYRHDPRTMLYAPLRLAIWEDPQADAWLTIDQPSTLFDSLGVPEVHEVGVELDRKLGTLLAALGVAVPAPLLRS